MTADSLAQEIAAFSPRQAVVALQVPLLRHCEGFARI
jgi:hypothetical protein